MLIQVKQRRPAQLTIATINAPRRFQLMTNILIGLNLTARRRRYLGVTNFTVMLRVFIQQRFRPGSVPVALWNNQTLNREYFSRLSSFLSCASFGGSAGSLLRDRRFNPNRIHFGVEGFPPYAWFSRLLSPDAFYLTRIQEREAAVIRSGRPNPNNRTAPPAALHAAAVR
jgi:hypothetical protein